MLIWRDAPLAASSSANDEVVCDLNVTPLVDITLVLLIVFIVTAKIIAGQTLQLELPKASTGSEEQTVLAIEIARTGTIAVNGTVVDSADRIAELARVAHDKNPAVRAVINADDHAEHGQVVKVMDQAKKAGITHIAFGITPAR